MVTWYRRECTVYWCLLVLLSIQCKRKINQESWWKNSWSVLGSSKRCIATAHFLKVIWSIRSKKYILDICQDIVNIFENIPMIATVIHIIFSIYCKITLTVKYIQQYMQILHNMSMGMTDIFCNKCHIYSWHVLIFVTSATLCLTVWWTS